MTGRTRHLLIALMIGVMLAAIVVFASYNVRERQQALVQVTTAQASEHAAYQIELLIGSRLGAGRHLQQLWRDGDISTELHFRHHAASLMGNFPGIRAIS